MVSALTFLGIAASAAIILRDSAHLQEEDTENARLRGVLPTRPATPAVQRR